MADLTSSLWANFLYEMQGKVQELFPTEHPFLAELSGVGDDSGKYQRYTKEMDTNREVFAGKRVRVPIFLAEMQGGGTITETGTWNVPQVMDTTEAWITMARVMQPFSLSVDVERDSDEPSVSAMNAVAAYTKQARQALASIENDMAHGNADAKLADITDSATSLTITTGLGTNYDRLYPNRVVDVLTKSNGADPGQGKRRKIASVNKSTGVVTFSTTATASDGGSGNIVHASTEGIYITGSYGSAVQGLVAATAVTGTFENVDKAAVPAWQGTDGRSGVTTVAALSDQLLDDATYLLRGAGVGASDFGIGHPKVIDLYKQSKYAQVRYEPAVGTLKSGFSGIVYDGADNPFPLIKDLFAPRQRLSLVCKDAIQLYGDKAGPAFLDDDGSMWRRFSRSLPREANLLDRVQIGFTACNKLGFLANLDEAGAAQH
jgi:hypothetical protein